jgi:precorrin-2 dehydrogenase / sirohydrochlorin ferrochelatase
MLRLDGKKVVVVGGGRVAERKVSGLLETGAQICVISPAATATLKTLAANGEINWQARGFEVSDIKGAFIIFAATNDSKVNQFVKEAAAPHQLVAVADDPECSDFHVPAHFKRGRLSIAVSTGGASPILAKKIRDQLETQFEPGYEDYLEFLFSKRQWILQEIKEPALKNKLLVALASPDLLASTNREMDFKRILEEADTD